MTVHVSLDAEQEVIVKLMNGESATEVWRTTGVPYQRVRKIAQAAGVPLKKGRRGGSCYTTPSPRDEVIVKALKAMRTYQDVADEFGVTRQRIEQIYKRWDGGARRGPGTAIEYPEAMAMLKDYIARSFTIHCLKCGTEFQSGVLGNSHVCQSCRIAISSITRLKVNLRSADKLGSIQAMRNAQTIIKKYGIQPADLDLV